VSSTLSRDRHAELREREAYVTVGAGWFLCALLGALPFLLTRATSDPVVALFESMSGITTTGFTALDFPLEQYPESIHLWRGALHFFGGLGIVLVAVAIITRLTEGAAKLLSMETGTGDVTRLRPKLTQTAKSLFGVYVTINLLCFVALWAGMALTGERRGWKDAAYHALVHSFSTVATGGLSSRSDSIGAFGSDAVNLTVWFFMVVSGVSFALYYRLFHGDYASFVSNPEFRFYLSITLLTSIGVAGYLWVDGHTVVGAFGSAFFHVATTITTTGLTYVNPDSYPDGAKLFLLLLMFTGGMVGSTAGGLKTARIYLLLRLTFRELQKLLHPHAVSVVKLGGRIFPEDSMRRIVVFFFVYVTTFIGGSFAFAALGMDLESSLSASAASLGNVGFGFGSVAAGFMDPVGPLARMLSFFLMWLGRLEIFTALLLFVPATYRS
jgi:trk system potassium uptake protein TrkH